MTLLEKMDRAVYCDRHRPHHLQEDEAAHLALVACSCSGGARRGLASCLGTGRGGHVAPWLIRGRHHACIGGIIARLPRCASGPAPECRPHLSRSTSAN